MIDLFRGPSGANSKRYNNKEKEPLHEKITTHVSHEETLQIE